MIYFSHLSFLPVLHIAAGYDAQMFALAHKDVARYFMVGGCGINAHRPDGDR
ncbi:hypothetical protein [Methanoculleus bourgensis]|nr:hypothetical protein [Methanoculleus bourgensis]